MQNYLHIVAFNIPYPANYGGVIDVYYKLKQLHQKGFSIILHCFEYNREKSAELEALCHKVYYYKRNTGILANFSILPYIVISRKNKALLNNLISDNYPVLFEGLHSSYYLENKKLRNKLKLLRCANIEHTYYWNLFKTERNSVLKSAYFLFEAFRLFLFERKIKHANYILPISLKETSYYRHKFPTKKTIFLPAFHENEQLRCTKGKGDYILYHGNLSVPENENAAIFLIKNVFSNINYPFTIAGLNPSKELKKLIAKYPNISLVDSPSNEEMDDLLLNAQAHILITFQSTGLKLKLLNVLFKGRFCIVNNKMLEGSGLEELCIQANTPNELTEAILSVTENVFDEKDIEKRREILDAKYSNTYNISTLIDLLTV